MQREALIALTVMLTLIALGARPGTDSVAQSLPDPAASPVIEKQALSANELALDDGAARLEITGTNDNERITLTMQLDVAI